MNGSKRARTRRFVVAVSFVLGLAGITVGCDNADDTGLTEEDIIPVDADAGGDTTMPPGDTALPPDVATDTRADADVPPTDADASEDAPNDTTVDTADVPPDTADVPPDSPDMPDVPPAEQCGNGIDDDADGMTDCADADCVADPLCQGGASEHCTNGLDDDGDGDTDCSDADCASANPCAAEVCDNGTDDDGDGFVDCADVECSAATVCRVEICANGKDDDGDGDSDCADSDCSATAACNPMTELCNDGSDNDGDLLTDCRDDDCASAAACTTPALTQYCTAEGQSCDSATDGVYQGDFRCLDLYGQGGEVCLATCDTQDVSDCPAGAACFDPSPADQDYAGLCFPRDCTTPFVQGECDGGETCQPYVNGYNYCRTNGTAQVGEACDFATSNCEAGLACVAGECRAPCDLSAPSCAAGESCAAYFLEAGYGACETTCTPYSTGECGAGESCDPADYQQIWVCRPESGTTPAGGTCAVTEDCGEGLFCMFEEVCMPGCASYAAACGAGESCVLFDDNGNNGVCAESCSGDLVNDSCPDTTERCVGVTDTSGLCYGHGGGAPGASCQDYLDCGQGLYCSQSFVCEQLCEPWDAAQDLCPSGQACYPFGPNLGACYPQSTSGRLPGEACSPADVLCDDHTYCYDAGPQGSFCLSFCRLSLSDVNGANPDCTLGQTCYPQGDELGICF